MKLEEVYKQMVDAANKCTEQQGLYRARDAHLDSLDYSTYDKDGDYWLDKYGKRVAWWRDEQNRLSNLILAHEAYYRLMKERNNVTTRNTAGTGPGKYSY
jgi:hypothetical protein